MVGGAAALFPGARTGAIPIRIGLSCFGFGFGFGFRVEDIGEFRPPTTAAKVDGHSVETELSPIGGHCRERKRGGGGGCRERRAE